jgi:hypothetical protein
MSFMDARDVGSKVGSGGVASAQASAIDRRERLRRLALETIDLAKDPYFMKNHLGRCVFRARRRFARVVTCRACASRSRESIVEREFLMNARANPSRSASPPRVAFAFLVLTVSSSSSRVSRA